MIYDYGSKCVITKNEAKWKVSVSLELTFSSSY